jgi:hypothetical protein
LEFRPKIPSLFCLLWGTEETETQKMPVTIFYLVNQEVGKPVGSKRGEKKVIQRQRYSWKLR